MRDDRDVTRRTLLALAGAAGLGAFGLEALGQQDQEKDEERREGEGGAQEEDRGRLRPPANLWQVERTGKYQAREGDVIEVAVPSNPSVGPNNPAANLRVEIEGQGLSRPFRPVYVPPLRPMPGAQGQIRAYLLADRQGEARVTVTPINGMGHPGEPLKFEVQVAP